jgi:hypothetical protein
MSEYNVGDVIDGYKLGNIIISPIYGNPYIMIQKIGSPALGMKKVIYYALYDDNFFIPMKRYNNYDNKFLDFKFDDDLDNHVNSENYNVYDIISSGGKSKRRKQKRKIKTNRNSNNKRKQRKSKRSSRCV